MTACAASAKRTLGIHASKAAAVQRVAGDQTTMEDMETVPQSDS
jgi:hypothetical protein